MLAALVSVETFAMTIQEPIGPDMGTNALAIEAHLILKTGTPIIVFKAQVSATEKMPYFLNKEYKLSPEKVQTFIIHGDGILFINGRRVNYVDLYVLGRNGRYENILQKIDPTYNIEPYAYASIQTTLKPDDTYSSQIYSGTSMVDVAVKCDGELGKSSNAVRTVAYERAKTILADIKNTPRPDPQNPWAWTYMLESQIKNAPADFLESIKNDPGGNYCDKKESVVAAPSKAPVQTAKYLNISHLSEVENQTLIIQDGAALNMSYFGHSANVVTAHTSLERFSHNQDKCYFSLTPISSTKQFPLASDQDRNRKWHVEPIQYGPMGAQIPNLQISATDAFTHMTLKAVDGNQSQQIDIYARTEHDLVGCITDGNFEMASSNGGSIPLVYAEQIN